MAINNRPVYHIPVLLQEVLFYLAPSPHGLYLDVTFGGGGHTRALLQADKTVTVIALDWDPIALKRNAPPLKKEFGERFIPIWGNFGNIYTIVKKKKLGPFDGILADFGTSQNQIHHQKGFSFQTDSPLDMRMSSAHSQLKASDVVNNYQPHDLAKIFYTLGEERFSRKIAHAIVEERKKQPFTTTKQLADFIAKRIPRTPSLKIHPATRTFQALRIYVNKELENINLFLNATVNLLKPNGRIVCISFHSLEDRIVKNFFRNNEAVFKNLTPKPIIADQEERDHNPSSRSAKLRAAYKIPALTNS